MVSGNLVYLFAAYLIIWVVLLGYVFYVSQQVSDLRSQLRSLRHDHPADPPSDGKR
jgi:CcmD family protein